MRCGLWFLAFLCFVGSAICSDPDPERIPLLANMQNVNNDNNAINLVEADQVERPAQLEEVVVDLAAGCARGILLPREGAHTLLGVGRDVWLMILSRLDQKNLMSMRLVNSFFHRLLTQPGETQHPLGEQFLLDLVDARLNAAMPQQTLPLDQFAAAIRSIVSSMEHTSLPSRYQDKLRPYVMQLWRLRYASGLSVNDVRRMLSILNLPPDNSFRSWFDARQLGSLHPSRLKGWLTEAAKAAIVFTTTGVGLWLIWTKPFQLPDTCKTIFAFPSNLLDGVIPTVLADLEARIMGSLISVCGLVAYVFSLASDDSLMAHTVATLKFRGWGKNPTYDEWVQIMQRRDNPPAAGRRACMIYGVLPILTVSMVAAAAYWYLIPGLNTVFTGQVTIANYIHQELEYNLPQNASCCAIAIDSVLGGSCPYIDANTVPNFGQLIPTATMMMGLTGMDILRFSLLTFQVLFSMTLMILNFL